MCGHILHTHAHTHTLQWGVFVSCLEWTVFVCTHTLGHEWKAAFGAAPQWVKTVMDNGLLLLKNTWCLVLSHSTLCRVLHSHWCVHCCRPTCPASLSLLHPPHTRVLVRPGRFPFSAVCSSTSTGGRSSSGTGSRGRAAVGGQAGSGGCVMCLGERVPGVMEDNGLKSSRCCMCVCLSCAC